MSFVAPLQSKPKPVSSKKTPAINKNRRTSLNEKKKRVADKDNHKRRQYGLDPLNRFGHRIQKSQSRKREQGLSFNPSVGKSLTSHLESFAAQGKDTLKSIMRSAKMLKSSAFESLLLKATWPEDTPVPQEALHQILHESIPAFEKYMQLFRQSSDQSMTLLSSGNAFTGYGGCDDPYYMTNHKLYMKMIESDWRTTLKSLYIFHSIFRESSPDICDSFRQAMTQMARKRALKFQTDHYKYFDSVMIAQTENAENAELELFIAHCTKFILHRAKHFSHSYDEFKDAVSALPLTDAISISHTRDTLAKSIKVFKFSQYNLELGLHCQLEKSFHDKTVAVESYRLIAKDVL